MKILMYILILVLGLFGFAIIRTIRIKDRKGFGDIPEIDENLALVYGQNLSRLIEIDTVNERGVDLEELEEKFKNYRERLKEVYPKVFDRLEEIPVDNAFLMKWKGKSDKRGSVVLLAHSDVVGGEGSWKYPMFSGKIADGSVWGRGAMDNKGAMTCLFEAVEALLDEAYEPVCDIYLASSHNEETMGDGARNMAAYFEDNNISLDLVLDEGGAVIEEPIAGLEGKFAMVGIMEKGYGDLKFTAKSGGGHSSTPADRNPLADLVAFANHINTRSPFKKRLTKPVRHMFENLAPYMDFPLRLVFGNLWLFSPVLIFAMPRISQMASALLKTTCVFTMAEASDAANVIPNEASLVANLRFMTHQARDESLKIMSDLAEKYYLEMEVLKTFDCSPVVDTETPMFKYVEETIRGSFPDAGLSTYVMMGGTDAKYFSNICPCTVRFSPLILSKEQLNSMHGVDENIDLVALARGVDFYKKLILNYS